jgi:polar amino acid transport system substrate-binding protein
MEQLGKEFLRIVKNPKTRRWLIGLGLVLLCLIFYKSCSFFHAAPNQVFRIGRDFSLYPITVSNKETNLLRFTDDLLESIAVDEGIDVEIFLADARSLLGQLDRGVVDGIVSMMTPDIVARESYYFSEPFFLLGDVLIVPIQNKASSVEEMKHKYIGIFRGSPFLLQISRFPEISVAPYDNSTRALDDLAAGRVDGVVMDNLSAYTYVKGFYHKVLRVATPPLTQTALRLVLRKEPSSEDFLKLFNEGLQDVKKDGTYDLLLQKWDLTNPEKIPQ